MSRISIVTIFYNIARMDRRKKNDNFSQQFGQAESTYVYIAYSSYSCDCTYVI